jgi:hypothetical protein
MKPNRSTLAVLSLTGCATTGVIPIGQDTYMVGKQGWTSLQAVTQIKADAFQEATKFCTSQGKFIQPVSTHETPGVPAVSPPSAEINFRCLAQGDKDLSRPTLTKVPDIVIENR